jgi:hypothetical protein
MMKVGNKMSKEVKESGLILYHRPTGVDLPETFGCDREDCYEKSMALVRSTSMEKIPKFTNEYIFISTVGSFPLDEFYMRKIVRGNLPRPKPPSAVGICSHKKTLRSPDSW